MEDISRLFSSSASKNGRGENFFCIVRNFEVQSVQAFYWVGKPNPFFQAEPDLLERIV